MTNEWGMSGALLAAVVGAASLAALAAVTGGCLWHRRQQRPRQQPAEEADTLWEEAGSSRVLPTIFGRSQPEQPKLIECHDGEDITTRFKVEGGRLGMSIDGKGWTHVRSLEWLANPTTPLKGQMVDQAGRTATIQSCKLPEIAQLCEEAGVSLTVPTSIDCSQRTDREIILGDRQPLEFKGDHCEVRKHSEGCAMVLMESPTARDAVLKLIADQTPDPEDGKEKHPEITIADTRVQLRVRGEESEKTEAKQDLFIAWGHGVDEASPLPPETIAQAFDKLFRETQASSGGFRVGDAMPFWFLPVDELMRLPTTNAFPRHQVWRDKGLLVKRDIHIEDVISGKMVDDTAAISHRWHTPDHPDPDGIKIKKLQEALKGLPSIRYLWLDWACAPQKHGGERTDKEYAEFKLILDNILPYIFLGSTVIVLYDREYNARFWPNVECWIATKMPTPDGLCPASAHRLRAKFYGIFSERGRDKKIAEFMMDSWHKRSAQEAINILSHDDIHVTNQKDKDICLSTIASLDERIQSIVAGCLI